MLNHYTVTPKVNAPTTNNNNFNFNAVSGTIFKSHPKSFFRWFQYGSKVEERLMGHRSEYVFNPEKQSWRDENGKYQYGIKPESVIVLQMMLTGENRVLAEIVREQDYYESPQGEEN